MSGSFQNRLSRNNVEIFHQCHNHKKFELLKFFFIGWLVDYIICYAIFSTVGHNFHAMPKIHVEEIVFGTYGSLLSTISSPVHVLLMTWLN